MSKHESRLVLDLVHPITLERSGWSPDPILKKAKEELGIFPSSVAITALHPSFSILPIPGLPTATSSDDGIAEFTKRCKKAGIGVYVILVVSGAGPCESPLGQISYDSKDSGGICIVNPKSRSMLKEVVGFLTSYDIDGVVLDLSDYYCASTTSESKKIVATCFCEYCRTRMRELMNSDTLFNLLMDDATYRLALRATGGGMEHIDPLPDQSTQDFLKRSLTDGFAQQLWDGNPTSGVKEDIEERAEALLRFTQVRRDTLLEALNDLFSVEPKLRKGVTIEGREISWTNGLCVEDASRISNLDFAWVSGAYLSEKCWYYALPRGRYMVNQFVEAYDPLVKMVKAGINAPQIRIKALLRRHAKLTEALASREYGVWLGMHSVSHVVSPLSSDAKDLMETVMNGIITGREEEVGEGHEEE